MRLASFTTLLAATRLPPSIRMRDDGAAGVRPPPEPLCNLLLQCAVQAQLSYHSEFKNEVKARWLAAFLGHEHLQVERVGRTQTRISYRGLSDGLRCSWRDYFLTMLRGEPETYSCRYKVGTADTAGMPSQRNATASALSYAAIDSRTAPIWCMIRPDLTDANTPPPGSSIEFVVRSRSMSIARPYALSAALCRLRAS